MLSKLIKSNFKNDFSHMITFFLIMVLSVFMFHTGIMIFIGYSTVHREKVEKYNLADMIVLTALKPEDMEEIEEIISTSDYIESYEKQYPINREFVIEKNKTNDDSKNAYDTSTQNLYILPYGEWGEIDAPVFTELSDEEYDNPIYISIYYNTNFFRAELGDSIDLKVNDKYYTFQVAGFYEGILSNAIGATYVKPSLYEEWKHDFEEMQEEAIARAAEDGNERPLYTYTVFNMKLVDGVDSTEATGRLTQTFSEHEILAGGQGVDEVITIFSFMQNMIAAMLMAFALIVAIISMIIIYFRIANSIEQNIVNIGALKALGYTSSQIRWSMILEFVFTTAFALATGVGLSYVVLPSFEKMMRSTSAVVWEINFNPVALIATLILIIGTVLFVSSISTRNIKKLDPVIALRFGINDHSFKRNHAPIEKTPGPLTWIMALKSLIGNTKQNVILFVVMLSIGMVTTFSAFIAYNCVYEPMHLYRMLQLEAGDVQVRLSENDIENYNQLAELPEVEGIWWTDTTQFNVEGYSVYATITDDWNDIPDVNVYEGRMPIYDNEIAIGGVIANILGVGIGDEVTVANANSEYTYIITGFEQNTSQMGKDISMTTDGARHVDYIPESGTYSINVKNHSLENGKSVIEKSEAMFGDKLVYYFNIIEALSTGEDTTIAIAGAMVGVMVIISLAVIVLSLNLLVKTLIIKKQKEIGIKKALGFSSSQLRTELVLSMLPQILFGAAVGSVLGYMGSNNVLASLLVSVGVMRSNMVVMPWMGIFAVAFSAVVSFVIIWMISGRIKKISAYSLITE